MPTINGQTAESGRNLRETLELTRSSLGPGVAEIKLGLSSGELCFLMGLIDSSIVGDELARGMNGFPSRDELRAVQYLGPVLHEEFAGCAVLGAFNDHGIEFTIAKVDPAAPLAPSRGEQSSSVPEPSSSAEPSASRPLPAGAELPLELVHDFRLTVPTLHWRPAGQIAKLVQQYACEVQVSNESNSQTEAANGASVTQLCLLQAYHDHTLRVRITGANRSALLDELKKLSLWRAS